jgi:hypothetical protein
MVSFAMTPDDAAANSAFWPPFELKMVSPNSLVGNFPTIEPCIKDPDADKDRESSIPILDYDTHLWQS